ncbi:MAG TPA: hypothetical protein P5572_15980, partial [Phycisphaerae bacterium]|nr:hypothetical protein [Phycisphaerae bacterium]
RYMLLNDNPTVYGQHFEGRPFMPPRGGLVAPNDNLLYSDILFVSQRASLPPHFILGVVFVDRDDSGDWTPRNEDDPNREGLAGILCTVYEVDTTTVVATDTTMSNGAFSLNVVGGIYDITFGLSDRMLRVDGITVDDVNVDVGDIRILDADELFAACLQGPGTTPAPERLGYTAQHCLDSFDTDNDLDVDLMDFAAYARSAVTPIIPGDLDGDGDIDLADFVLFTNCLTGPDAGATLGCSRAVLDGDDDVDLADFGAWQRTISGAHGTRRQ